MLFRSDFNQWNQQSHAMQPSDSGIWTLFIPGLREFDVYKYCITTQSGQTQDKADPYGFAMEERPRTGSVIANLERYEWQDSEWMATRKQRQSLESPISIYEVHLGSWRKMADEKWGLRYFLVISRPDHCDSRCDTCIEDRKSVM